MDKLFYFILILFYFSLVENKYVDEYRDSPRKIICTPSTEITNCEKGRKTLYRNQDLKIRSTFKWCVKDKYTFDYELVNEKRGAVKFHNNLDPMLIVRKFTLDPGKYNVVLKVLSPKKEILKLDDKCEITIKAAPLHVYINYGIERNLRVGKKLVVEASQSMDFSNVNPTDPKNLEFSWVYNCVGCSNFSSGQDTDSELTINGKNHIKHSRYLIKLGLKSKWWPTMTYAYQTVNVLENDPEIVIQCNSKCNSEYYEIGMSVNVKCLSNCGRSPKFVLSVYLSPDNDISLITGTENLQLQFSNSSSTGHVDLSKLKEMEKLPPGKTFLLRATLENNNSSFASYKFKTAKDFDFTCSLWPRKGIVLETLFRVNCTGQGFGSFFWVTVKDVEKDREIKLDFDSSWKYLSFFVPVKQTVCLRFVHYSGTEGEVCWDPNSKDDKFYLADKELKFDAINDSYNKGNESVENLLNNFEYRKVLNTMTLIAKSMKNFDESDKKKIEPMINDIVSDLRKVPMTSIANIEQASGIMDTLTSSNTTLNPALIKTMSGVCRNLSELHENEVESNYFTNEHEQHILLTVVSRLMRCSVNVIRPNISAIESRDSPTNVTTVNYTVIEPETNTEVYDEYMDEVVFLENKDYYKGISSDFFEICFNNGKAIKKSINLFNPLARNKEFLRTDDFSYVMTTMKSKGSELHNTFYFDGILVTFPADFAESEETYTSIVCATNENIFWWEKKVQMISYFLAISVFKDDTEITKFKGSFMITLDIISQPIDKFPYKTFSIDLTMSDVYDSHANKTKIPVYIIALDAGTSLVIEFWDMPENVTLHVISTDFEIPTANHFSGKKQIINQNNSYFVDSLINDHQGFRLISVAPTDSSKGKLIKFKMTAYAVSCLKWDSETKSWKSSCKGKFSIEAYNIICLCKTLSTITATMENVEIKEWLNYIPLNISIDEQYFHSINIFMVSIYLLYFILLCFAMKEVDCTQKSVYFLSDVIRESLYGYVIVTKTGTRSGAGTTSNVTIKIIGRKTESQPHVLNYPDPLLKILQKGNQDWFFLATEFYLGKILEIELWYDGIGAQPSWYCSKVYIYDIQSHQWYEFRVSSLFTIYPKPKVYTRVKVFEISKDNSFKRKLFDLMVTLKPEFRIFHLSLRQTDESRSYVKRLTLMFSIVISIAFWCIVCDGIPSGAADDFIMRLCEYQLNYRIVLNGICASIITAIFHIPIVHLFTVSKVQFPSHLSSQKQKRPFVMTMLCWSIIIISINVYSTLIVCYGVRLPTVTAYLIISAIVIGLIFYILVIETMAGIVMRYMKKKVNQNESYVKRNIKKIMRDVEKQREVLYVMYGKYLLRPFLQHLYQPMQKVKIKYRWIVEKMKYEVRELLENLVMFVIYTTLMYMIILANRDYHSVYSNKEILKIVDGSLTKTIPLDAVITMRNLEEYIEETLIGATQLMVWYGKYVVRDPGKTLDNTNKMIGVIRIRQHRSMADSCVVPEAMRFINRSCYGDYFKSKSFMDYGLRWNKVDSPPSEGRMRNVWKYTNSSETGTFPFLGKLGFYTGGGYVAYLGRSKSNSHMNLNYLQQYSWFDVLTRSIFIEFLLYTPNSNTFNAVQLTIEKSVTGYLKSEIQIETSRMLHVNTGKFTVINSLLAIFLLIVAFLTFKTLLRIWNTGIWYFKDIWRLIDIILILLSYTCIVLYYKRSTAVGTLLKSLEGAEPRDFVNYFPLYRVDHSFTITASLLITVATVKLWLLFRFLVIFKVAERTFSTAFFSLCAVYCYHMIALTAFAVSGYVLFVDHSYKFAGLANTMEFLTELNFRAFSHEERLVLDTPNMSIGYLFYLLYSFTVMISNCIYMALILIHYSEAKEYFSRSHEIYSVKNHLKKQIHFYYDLIKIRLIYFRLKGGKNKTENPTPVEPKSDEHRYADSFTLGIDKLRAMSLVSLCVINNSNFKRKSLSQKDIRLMTYTLYYLTKIRNEQENDDEVERFYKGYLGGNTVKIVPEFQLTKMEAVTSILLGQPVAETMRKLNINQDITIIEENGRRIRELKNKLTQMVDALNTVNLEPV